MDEFDLLFGPAKKAHLTPMERAVTRKVLEVHIAKNPVRATGDACHRESMSPPERQFVAATSGIRLTSAQRARTKDAILKFVQSHPVRVAEVSGLRGAVAPGAEGLWSTVLFLCPRRLMPIFSIVLAMFVAFGGAVSYAADGALPGDFLYAFKIHVNEGLRLGLTFSEESRARFEAERAERRLQEAEALVAQDRLTDDVRFEIQTTLDQHIENAQQDIATMSVGSENTAAAAVSAAVEKTIEKHRAVYLQISGVPAEAEADASISAKAAEGGPASMTVEAGAPMRASTDAAPSAEGAIRATENKIREVRSFLGRAGVGVSADARLKLDAAAATLTDARAKFAADAHNDAFLRAKEAARLAQQAKLLLEARGVVGNSVTIDSHEDSSASESGRSESKVKIDADAGAKVDIDVQGNGTTPVNANSNAESTVKVKVGD